METLCNEGDLSDDILTYWIFRTCRVREKISVFRVQLPCLLADLSENAR